MVEEGSIGGRSANFYGCPIFLLDLLDILELIVNGFDDRALA